MECRFCRCEVTEVSFVQARRWSLCLKAGRIQTFHPTTRAWAPNSLATARSLSAFLGLRSSWRLLTPKVIFMILIEWLYDQSWYFATIWCPKKYSKYCGIYASYQAVINSAQSMEQAQHKNQRAPLSFLPFRFATFTAPNAKLRVIGPAS